MQSSVDHLSNWCGDNGMRINVPKTKEMVIYFGKMVGPYFIPDLTIGSNAIERVNSFKFWGL